MKIGFGRFVRVRGALRLDLVSVLGLAIVALALTSASSGYAAETNRAESDVVVSEAEAIVVQAGKTNPVDTRLIHQAMDKLRIALKMDPRNDSAYVDLGFCYSVLRDGDTAVEMYRTATDLNPSGNNFIELADIYMRVGDPEDALLATNAGLVKDPTNARLYNAKGMALNDLQRFGEAEEAWEKALRMDPDLKVAQVNLQALNAGQTGRGSISKHSQPPPNPAH